MTPDPITKFIDSFSRLPALGPRLATRLAFYLTSLDRETLHTLALALNNLKGLTRCERCFFLKQETKKICAFCSDVKRDPKLIAIVEKDTDILALEQTGSFKGQYLVLGELPERGTMESSHKLRLAALKERIRKELGGKAKEIIVAVNPTTFGDFVVDTVQQEFKDFAERITRLGRGIPTGGEIEFTDAETLISSLERRQ